MGPGKGIATYFRPGFQHILDVTQILYQMTKVANKNQDVINIYRSAGASSNAFLRDLDKLIDTSRETVLVGDFNLCYLAQRSHPIVRELESKGFIQLVKHPTHVEGRLIDLIFYFEPDRIGPIKFTTQQKGLYFTDHDMLHLLKVIISFHSF